MKKKKSDSLQSPLSSRRGGGLPTGALAKVGGEVKKKTPANNFFTRVYAVARKIPRGRVTSYGAIAKYLGAGKSSRMVGWAMNSAHSAMPPVPAHRVVNRIGLLTGQHHFAYPGQMQELLENEGIEVMHNKVKDFDELFWEPMKELKPFR